MNIKHTEFDFNQAWKKIDSLEQKGLYKSAMKIVESIYAEANKSNIGGEKVKALFYKGKYTNYIEEDNLESFEKMLIKEVANSEFPDKQLFQSILAEFYFKYLNAYIWKIKNRTETGDNKNTDIQSWAASRFINESTKLFNASISHSDLKKIPYTKYANIFTDAKNTINMRDNLYEILVHRALFYFKNDRNYLPTTTKSFSINNANYFEIPAVFTGLELKSTDKNDPKYKTLLLFQQLEKHNLETKDYEELLDVTLRRLEFVKAQYLKQDKEKLYLNTLQKLTEKYLKQDAAAEVNYKIAMHYKNSGSNNNPETKWNIRKARNICLMVEENYPETYGDNLCRSLRSQIEKKQLRINAEKVNLPNENLLVSVEFRDLNKVYFKLVKINSNQFEKYNKLTKDRFEFVDKLNGFKNWEVNLPADGDYRNHRVETEISPLDNGIYILIASNNSSFKKEKGIVIYQFLHISNLSFWTRTDHQGNYVFVVDRKTGKPINNSIVELSYQDWNRQTRVREKKIFITKSTNSNGFISFNSSDKHRNYNIKVTKGNDILEIKENIYIDRIYPSSRNNTIMFFTDRAIYRPGQTVYYKGIYLQEGNDDQPSIVKNKSGLKIQFNDANHQKISEVIVSTNDFGSFNGSFTIPQSGLTGNMMINETSTRSNISFKVEEYKRPKFEVIFEDYTKSYMLGNNVKLKGMASSFSGFPLPDAKVVYTVKRKVYYPYYGSYFRRPSQRSSIEISHGETITNEKGNFTIPVELFVGDVNLNDNFPSFHFEIKADVIDMTGETHSAIKTLNAGVTEVNISMQNESLISIKDSFGITILSKNHSGQKVNAKGKVSIYKLIEPNKYFRSRFWVKPDTFIYNRSDFYDKFPSYAYKNDDDKHQWEMENSIKTINFDTESNEEYKVKLTSGEYKLILEFNDPSGKKIKIEKYTSVYSKDKNPAKSLVLVQTDKEEYSPTSGANIRWQSAISGLNIYYSIWKRKYDVLGKQWLNLNNSNEITIKILDKHRGGVIVGNTFVYNNRFYEETKYISVPWSNKQLDFEYMSFRSKLYPGQDEEWRVKIKGGKSDKLMGEILAGMYDASLDKIYTKDWQKIIHYPNVNHRSSRSYGFGTANQNKRYSDMWNNYNNNKYHRNYRALNWFGFHVSSNRHYYNDNVIEMRSTRKMMNGGRSRDMDAMEVSSAPSANAEMIVHNDVSINTSEKESNQSNIHTKETEKVQLRTNLNETVFFYPDIVTDENGDFILKFKMNDALTKWKLRMFAHTKDLKFGYDEKEVITQKELMITPNNPRFVREGDNLTFKARIDNLTDKSLNGNAWVEIFDAESMKPLETVFLTGQKNIDFSTNAKGSALVTWKMEFPKNVSNLLIYRFYAKSGSFSDAEEGILPVLTNQKLITETMPLWVGGNETKSFTFKSLKNSIGKDLKNINFTIEATSHPIWLAIQSLPYLKNVQHENSISITNALFSNLLAKKITDDNPKIKRVFDTWNNGNSAIDKEALLSNLNKNQELKNILLEETPWVLDAIDEEEQKRNIALLFDLNQVKNNTKQFVNKLKGLQNPNGGFPWFKNGKGSRYITQYVIETFGRMKNLGMLKDEREIDDLLNRAIQFINTDVVKNYEELLELAAKGKIDLDKNHLGSIMIHYMYALQFYPDITKSNDLQEAYDYYFGQAKKYWLDRPLYLKGMLSLVLHRGGETDIAKEVLKAAEEQSIFSEELGRYWKSYHGYHWWQLPIETQALMIEAFTEVKKDNKIKDQLKVWLLKNKQTNRWKTDKATVSAIYSLLFDNGGTINETGLVKIYIAGNDITKDLINENIQAGTGYYKKKWSGDKVKSSMSEIKIENPNKDIAWGAVYWQYLQDLDKIETFEDTPLKIQRTLYLLKNTDKGEKMTEIEQSDILQPGDLIKVKIRLQVDREMEFVHLSDQRAATFEPIEQLSKYHWQGGLGYYQNPRDTKMNFFIDFLPRGVFVLEYPLRVTQTGTFSNGIAELQSFYAPEFSSHSEGLKIVVR